MVETYREGNHFETYREGNHFETYREGNHFETYRGGSSLKAERPIRIFLVEDNPEDVAITQRALEKSGQKYLLEVVMDGQEALDNLLGTGSKGPRPPGGQPDIILLDLNLPRLDGREVLKILKENPELKRIPIIVLTTSQRDEDILRSYDLGVNTYIRKPVSFDRFLKVIETLQQYWVAVATLPSHSELK